MLYGSQWNYRVKKRRVSIELVWAIILINCLSQVVAGSIYINRIWMYAARRLYLGGYQQKEESWGRAISKQEESWGSPLTSHNQRFELWVSVYLCIWNSQLSISYASQFLHWLHDKIVKVSVLTCYLHVQVEVVDILPEESTEEKMSSTTLRTEAENMVNTVFTWTMFGRMLENSEAGNSGANRQLVCVFWDRIGGTKNVYFRKDWFQWVFDWCHLWMLYFRWAF